jgi:pSer/pThr/pTyr-binding forkhead associated (FHA) protein
MFTRISLTVVEGPHRGEEAAWVGRTEITVGRSEECAFPLRGAYEDVLVSRRHCLIAVRPEGVEVRDLESLNGTYVNGRPLGSPAAGGGSTAFSSQLRDGDEIRIGTSALLVGIREVVGEAERCEGTDRLLAKLPVA